MSFGERLSRAVSQGRRRAHGRAGTQPIRSQRLFGLPKFGSSSKDGPRRGRDQPRAADGRSVKDEGYDWREYQRRKKEAAEERESKLRSERSDTAHEKCRQDLLDLGIDPNVPSEINSQYLGPLSLTGVPERQRSMYMYGYSALAKNGPVRCTLRHHADMRALTSA